MIKPARVEKTPTGTLAKTPEPTRNNKSITPLKSMINQKRRIIIGPIETIGGRNKSKINLKHSEKPTKEESN